MVDVANNTKFHSILLSSPTLGVPYGIAAWLISLLSLSIVFVEWYNQAIAKKS
jgi:hypothetical protein